VAEAIATAEERRTIMRGELPLNPAAEQTQTLAPRNIAVDAYRGFVMLLMMAEVMQLSVVALHYPHSVIWQVLGYNQSHVEWIGMSLHDTIQPSFTFLVGVAMPYSLRSRQRRGESFAQMFSHTVWRSFVLVALGIFLRSTHSTSTYFTFEDTLTQIGLGYTFVFLIARLPSKAVWTAFGVILFGYWLAWALYPLPSANFDYASVGVSPDWQSSHLLHGFAAHWNKNANLGQAFDQWFLNRLPRSEPFRFNDGGYLTLSFIPTLATMLLGLLAGRWFIEKPGAIPFRKLLIHATWLIVAGLALDLLGINPIVKRIWTPAWTLFSGGFCMLMLSAFSYVVDVRGHRKLAFPLVVIGMNSIAAYLMAHLWEDFLTASLKTHLGTHVLDAFGANVEPVVSGLLILAIYYVTMLWMYRNRVFIRI
jgi:heparan-alpha-glucosaminide N-acetyltransferase